jgi:hypothetical protein
MISSPARIGRTAWIVSCSASGFQLLCAFGIQLWLMKHMVGYTPPTGDSGPQGSAFVLNVLLNGNFPGWLLWRDRNCRCDNLGSALNFAANILSRLSMDVGCALAVRSGFSHKIRVPGAISTAAINPLPFPGSFLTSNSVLPCSLLEFDSLLEDGIVAYSATSSSCVECYTMTGDYSRRYSQTCSYDLNESLTAPQSYSPHMS